MDIRVGVLQDFFFMKKLIWILIPVLLIGNLAFTPINSHVSPNDYTGEEYFKAIFFMDGELTKSLTAYKTMLRTNPPTNEEIDFQNYVLKQLPEGYFRELKSAIESKKHVAIDAAITKGGDLMLTALRANKKFTEVVDLVNPENIDTKSFLDEKGEISNEQFLKEVKSTESLIKNNIISNESDEALVGFAIVWAFYAVVVAHNTIAVTANLAVAAAVWKWVCIVDARDDGTLGTNPTLKYEILVNDLANL